MSFELCMKKKCHLELPKSTRLKQTAEMTAAVAPRLIKLSTEKDGFIPVLCGLSLSDANN